MAPTIRTARTLLLTLTLSATAARAETARTHEIGVADYFTLAAVLDAVVSPDGKHVAYVDLRWESETKARNGDLWVVDRKTRESRRLTFDPSFDAHPVFSPDSRWIYFTSSRTKKKKQVWRIGTDGRGLRQITRRKSGILSFRLSHDGTAVYFAVGVKQTQDPWRSLKSRFGEITYGHGVVKVADIHSLDLSTWRSTKRVATGRVLVDWDVARDQSRIAMITRPTEELITNEGWSTVDVWDRKTGATTSLEDAQWRKEARSPYGWLDAASWSADGKSLSFTVDYDGFPSRLYVARLDSEKPTITQMKRPGQCTVNGGARAVWLGDDLLFACERNARVRVMLIEDAATNEPEPGVSITAGDLVVGKFSATANGKEIAFTASDPSGFGDVWVAGVKEDNADRERLTDVNPQTATWKLPTLQIVSWKSADGQKVDGILALPHGHEAGEKLPMVVYIHGGPASATKYRLRFWGYGRTLMAAKGYATFSPNYRGSTGYGDRFLVELIGRKNDIDVKDILTGVDAMVARGIADPDRLGVMGWSNGGYLTNCVITHTDRFKAASSGAGVFDVAMQWAIEDTPGHVINYQGGLPWEKAEGMRKASPMYDVNKVKTPTLIHVGENDPRVPPEHARALHRALHHYLKVPTELLVYPGAGHGLSKYSHRKAKMEWDLAWFEKYLARPAEEPSTN